MRDTITTVTQLTRPESTRAHERVRTGVPVSMDGRKIGVTLEISPSGALFETSAKMTSGSSIQFALEFDNPGGALVLHCVGEVVRVEKAEGTTRVAVRIVDSRLERSP